MKTPNKVRLIAFETPIGPCAIAFAGREVIGLQLPQKTKMETLAKLAKRFESFEVSTKASKWEKTIIDQLKTHLRTGKKSLHDLNVSIETTPFFSKVYETVQNIPPGQRMTYGEVAKRIGAPKAARAVGQAMARNPVPLIIPCHRVVGSTGKLTGFSAMDGVKLKSKLLEIEARK